jgi:hypothetical protein
VLALGRAVRERGRGGVSRRKLEEDAAGGLVAQGDFDAVEAVDGGVAGGGAAEDFDAGAGQEAQVREVVADLFGQVDGLYNARIANLRIAQSGNLRLNHFSLRRYPTNLVLFIIRHLGGVCL